MKTDRKRRLLTRSFRGLATLLLIVPALLAGNGLARAGGNPNGNGASNLIPNNTPGFIRKAVDLGAVDPSTQISITVWLQLHNENQLDQTVRALNRKGSSQYHQWLSQSQFNAVYSPTSQEVNAVENFLSAHSLSVLNVAENNFYIEVQGSVGDVERAFHVQIDNYNLNGALYRSNTADPSVNGAPNGLIAAITGLDDYGYTPTLVRPTQPDGTPYAPVPLSANPNGLFFESQCFRGTETHTFTATTTISGPITATYTGNRYGADIANTTLGHLAPCGYQPSEMQAAYDMGRVYAAGLNGSGQTVVIVDAFGSATIAQDANVFSSLYGLPALTPSNFQVYQAPGSTNSPKGAGWDGETTLDVEWAHAMAPGANIALVIAPNNRSDLDQAINWAVIHHLGNTISNSWSAVEGFGNPRQLDRVNRILEQAAAEGIDVNFASGDFGDEAATVGFQSVDFPASSPFATGVGGTSVALNADNSIAFQTGWGTNLTAIADTLAKGNPPFSPPSPLGFQFGAGGGPSLTFARPDFQSGLGVPGNTRLVPDIAMPADPFTGVEIIETVGGQLTASVIGGTSLSCPIFSAIMAIAAQKAGHGLGQAAPLLYSLAPGAITDVTPVGSPTNVTGSITTTSGTTNYSADQLATPEAGVTTYYSALYNSPFSTRWFVITFGTDTSLTTSSGWDDVTGLGTPNGAAFVNALAP